MFCGSCGMRMGSPFRTPPTSVYDPDLVFPTHLFADESLRMNV